MKPRHVNTLVLAGPRRREAAWLSTWPRELRRVLEAAHGAKSAGATRKASSRRATPYWKLLPPALAAAYGHRRIGRQLVGDAVWGQHCLFAYVRLHDDVFDGQARDAALLFVADQYLVEAERTFARHFPRSSRFWTIFLDCLQTSTRAIVEVDAWQQRGQGHARSLLAKYAEVAAIFKVGVTAVCLKAGRAADLPALARFSDGIARAGQICDDLTDVAEDLRRGRFNYVAQLLLPRRRRPSTEEAEAFIARAIVSSDGAARVFREVRRNLEAAARAVRGLRCPAPREHVHLWRREVDRMEKELHRRSVRAVLAGLDDRVRPAARLRYPRAARAR